MKNFSDLLAIETCLIIEILTDHGQSRQEWPLTKPIDLVIKRARSVKIDGMEMMEFGYWVQENWHIHHDQLFYRWRHQVTGQGWLLDPQKTAD